MTEFDVISTTFDDKSVAFDSILTESNAGEIKQQLMLKGKNGELYELAEKLWEKKLNYRRQSQTLSTR